MDVKFKVLNTIHKILPIANKQSPILICGMPKSGTTAISMLLAKACRMSICSDPFHILDCNNIDFRERLFSRKLSIDKLWNSYPYLFNRQIIKDPNFPLILPDLHKCIENASYVYIVRDSRHNIRSILNRLKLPSNPNEVDLSDVDVPPIWRNVLNGINPNIPGDNYIERLAWRWKISVDNILLFKDRGGVIVKYEEFNKNKRMTIVKIANALKIPVKSDISEYLNHQFQPKGNNNVPIEQYYRRNEMDTINSITGETLRALGYL
jgi:hypothetical protein